MTIGQLSKTCMLICLCLQKDICLLHEIEDIVGKQLEAYECSDKEVTKNITKVHTSWDSTLPHHSWSSSISQPIVESVFYEHWVILNYAIIQVFKAQRLARMKMDDEGHGEKVQARKEQKKRDLVRKRKHEGWFPWNWLQWWYAVCHLREWQLWLA